MGLSEVEDPDLLKWTAKEERVLLTHGVNTITKFAYARLSAGLAMPGVIAVREDVAIGQAIQDILLLAEFEEERQGQIRYVPL